MHLFGLDDFSFRFRPRNSHLYGSGVNMPAELYHNDRGMGIEKNKRGSPSHCYKD